MSARRLRPMLLLLLAGSLAACASGPPRDNAKLRPATLRPQLPAGLPSPAVPHATLWLGGEITPDNSGRPVRESLVAAARDAVLTNAGALGVDQETRLAPPATVHIVKEGPNTVQFKQVLDGIEVFHSRINVALDDAARAMAITGGFSPRAGTRHGSGFHLDGPEAITAALRALRLAGEERIERPQPAGERSGWEYYEPAPTSVFRPRETLRLKRTWYPAPDRLIAAYYMELMGARLPGGEPIAIGAVVSAEDGTLLGATSLISEAAFTYRVFADPGGHPYMDAYGDNAPHPTGMPDGWHPTVPAPMNLVTLEHAGISTGDPWLPDTATVTAGNNVEAFFSSMPVNGGVYARETDYIFNAAEGDFHASVTGTRRFDYAYDVTATAGDYFQNVDTPPTPIPVTSLQLNAKIVQAFYTANWLHDLFYDLGYDEAAGNTQEDNFGRGGIGGDRLAVHASAFGTFANTPEDGEQATIVLAQNRLSGTLRDPSGFDLTVFGHEWGHTMFRRLTDTMADGGQPYAINEGTGDFIGSFLTVRDTHRFHPAGPFKGAYPNGAYFNLDYDNPYDPVPAGAPDNAYYHGTRRFPYSADPAVNPLTFRHIAYSATLPPGFTAFDWKGRSLVNPEVHNVGEIWANALWQCASNILGTDRHLLPFNVARRRVLAYLVAGLKLMPSDPTFTEARDAVLFAVRIGGPVHYEVCREGFAARGMGAGALSPPRESRGLEEVQESFDPGPRALSIVGWTLEELPGEGDGDGVLDFGETGRLTVTLKNTGFEPLRRVRLYVPPVTSLYRFPSGSLATDIVIGTGAEHSVSFDVSLNTPDLAMLPFNLSAYDENFPEIAARQDAAFRVNYDLVRDTALDYAISDEQFRANWTLQPEYWYHGFIFDSYPDVDTWRLVRAGRYYAYELRSERLQVDIAMATAAFRVADVSLRLIIEHEYDFPTETRGAAGTVEISIDGAPWEEVTPYLVTGGSGQFTESSGGTARDTLDLGTVLAGRCVQFRLRARAYADYDYVTPHELRWAIRRVAVHGAAEPVFYTKYGRP